MKLPEVIREQFRRHGARGGRTRAGRLLPVERTAIARRAALRRWTEARFGNARFEALGLPGGEAVDTGLDDLVAGKESMESLMVSLAAPRLRREGLPLPATILQDAEIRLFRLLERSAGELAHARYLACLRQISSFADACRTLTRNGRRRAK
ncbi:MAG: hypothetical protein SGI90_13030 [Candidatus Eisenbacteria bacterium]|nr:hypothetical protein [Candidatus Eisenbacteria bacterium]